MSKKTPLQRYLDAGTAFTNITRARAEELVQELVKSGAVQRKEAKGKVDDLLERSRKSSEQLINVVRDEVANQLRALGISNLEDLARQVAAVLNRSTEAARAAGVKATGGGPAPAKKAPAKKKAATAKAPAPKKATAKKAAPHTAAAAAPHTPSAAAPHPPAPETPV